MILYYVEMTPVAGYAACTFGGFPMQIPAFLRNLFALFTGSTANQAPTDEVIAPPPAESNFDWRLPEADERKLALVGSPWGETVNTYLWYEIGEINNLTDEEIEVIKTKFFIDISDGGRFGNIELHHSSVIPGIVLRLRGKVRRLPSFELRGRHCSLYQIGHSGGFCEAPTPDSVNFHHVWNKGSEVSTDPVPAT